MGMPTSECVENQNKHSDTELNTLLGALSAFRAMPNFSSSGYFGNAQVVRLVDVDRAVSYGTKQATD